MMAIEESRFREHPEVLIIKAADDTSREDIAQCLRRDFSFPYGRKDFDLDKFIPRPDSEYLPEQAKTKRKYVSPVAEPPKDDAYYLARAAERRAARSTRQE